MTLSEWMPLKQYQRTIYLMDKMVELEVSSILKKKKLKTKITSAQRHKALTRIIIAKTN
jgi:hypothetical protein